MFNMATYIRNKKAKFDYEIKDTLEAGVVLFGHEVKAIRNGKGKLEGAHVIIRGNEAFLVNSHVSPYQEKNTSPDYDPNRPRKLLLSQKELTKLEEDSEHAGLTIVPISWYNKNGKIKLEIAVARGKKKTDKRETIKERDSKRAIDRLLKSQR